MTKTFLLLFCFLFLASCNSGGDSDCQQAVGVDEASTGCSLPDDTTEPGTGETTGSTTGGSTTGSTTGGSTTGSTTGGSTTGSTTGGTTGSTTGVPDQALTWDTNIYMVNFNATQEAKIDKAVVLLKKVIASKEFRDRILNYTYNGQKAFVDNGGFTNAQIYQKILDGAEKMGITTKNNTMDVELELYYAATSTVGYTYPNSVRIWMNTKYFNNYTPVNVSDNLTHEWLHKLGFGHASSWSARRDHSVPYAIGYLVEELAAKY